MRLQSILYISAGFVMFGCSGDKDGMTFAWQSSGDASADGSDTGNTDSDSTDSGDDSDSDSPTDTNTDTDGGDDGLGADEFEDPGDVVLDEDDDDGVLDIDLTDVSGEDNQNHEFYLVFVNTGEDDNSFSLQYSVPSTDDTGDSSEEEEPPQRPPMASKPAPKKEKSEFKRRLEKAKEEGRINLVQPPTLPPPPTTDADIGNARQMFKVRDDVDDESSWEDVEAILWAVGTYVDIWVDTSVAIDWDFECDGQPDVYDAPDQLGRNAYGFDNCDLQTIANIVDVNIFPNLRAVFGDESDVNGDSKVSVVITPVLNQMTASSSEDDDLSGSLVGSYADPSVDLAEFDPDENPVSDEMEVIYIHAPDPFGFHNPSALTPVTEYTNVSLGTQIAGALFSLISYNQHVVVFEGSEEEAWINKGLAALAADLTGFGAPYHKSVWEYMDAPHLTSLTTVEDSESSVAVGSYGAQYLFFRWLVDAYGVEILADLVQTGDTGTENIESVMQQEMGSLALLWQLALLSKHSTDSGSGLDISTEDFPPFLGVEFATAPISSPSEGDLFGANGYQMGIDIGGANQYIQGGTTNNPLPKEEAEVKLSHTDHSTLVYGQDFYGFATGGYGAQIVRLVDVPFSATELEIRAAAEGYKVAVIRAEDPDSVDFSKDTLYSATQVDDVLLPSLPLNGSPIYGLGDITLPGNSQIIDSDGESSATEVADTDRWLLSLSNYPPGSEVRIGVWLDHRYSGLNGDVQLADPWLAVVPKELLPVPTVDGTQSGTCTDGVTFGFPYLLLDHLYYQVMLSSTAYDDTDLIDYVPEGEEETEESEEGEESEGGSSATGFDPCGSMETDPTTCDIDWDRDGVLNENEPQPETLISQMRVMQCTLAGNDWSGVAEPIGLEVIDADEQDEDEDPTYDRKLNVGSVSVEGYEGAYIDINLQGGKDYVIVVGASSGVGPYEFTVKKLPLQ